MKLDSGADEATTELSRLRHELEDRDRIIQSLLLVVGRGRPEDSVVTIGKREYLSDPLKVQRDQHDMYFVIRLVSSSEGWRGLGQLPEWAQNRRLG